MHTLAFSGERLRDACAAQGMTAQVLAQRSGHSVAAVYTYWSGRARPGANQLAALAEALAVPIEAFYVRVPLAADEQAAQAPAPGAVA